MNNLLSDKWLENLPNTVVNNMQQQNIEVIKVICDRLKEFGDLRPTEIHKLTNSIEYMGADLKAIENIIQKYTSLNKKEVKNIFEQAAKENDIFAEQYYKHRGLSPITFTNDEYLNGLYRAISDVTFNSFANISDTYGFKFAGQKAMTLRKTYTTVIDRAIYEVQSGVIDYNTAIRQTVKKLSDSGIKVIDWDSGYSRRADTSARMNILDGVRRLNQEMMLYHGEKFGSDGVELTAHAMSAPDHLPVQGHQFSNEEFNKMQDGEPCKDINGKEYTAFDRPIGEWNCKHFALPIVIGVSKPVYTDEQLEQMKNNSLEKYGATQEMRKKEAELRKLKERRMAFSSAGNDLAARQTQKEINIKQKEYNNFCAKNDLKPKPNRATVDGYKRIAAGDKSLTFEKENDIIKMYRKGSTHRKVSETGIKIIDKPTFHKITNPAIKAGADIRFADDEWENHLIKNNATAVTIGNVIIFSKNITVSDVLEEVYHFWQNKKGTNSNFGHKKKEILNEIEAKKYLLSISKKYNIPSEENELTKNQLVGLIKTMEKLKEKGEW